MNEEPENPLAAKLKRVERELKIVRRNCLVWMIACFLSMIPRMDDYIHEDPSKALLIGILSVVLGVLIAFILLCRARTSH